jgi:DNA replication protein DnaC
MIRRRLVHAGCTRRSPGTSNRAFSRWGEIFGDEIVAAAIVDRLVHHADVIAPNGDSYRLKHRRPTRAGGTT